MDIVKIIAEVMGSPRRWRDIGRLTALPNGVWQQALRRGLKAGTFKATRVKTTRCGRGYKGRGKPTYHLEYSLA